MRTLIGAVGYRNLRDFSAAFEVVDRLFDDWQPGIESTETFMYLRLVKQTYSWGVR